MKNIILATLCVLFSQCTAQKNINIMVPIVDNTFEKFDIDSFNEKKISNSSSILLKNDKTIEQWQTQSYGYIIRTFYNDSYYIIIRKYHENLIIKDKGKLFNEGSPIGIWYHFDEEGKLIKEENTDEGYQFLAADVVKYCERHKIELPKGYYESGYQTHVIKEEFEGKKAWRISFLNKKGKIEEIVLDGVKGKELNRRFVNFVGS